MREGEIGDAFAYAPLHEFGDMLTKNVTNRIQRHEGKPICACWWIARLVCVPVSISVRIRMSAWIADLRAEALCSDFM